MQVLCKRHTLSTSCLPAVLLSPSSTAFQQYDPFFHSPLALARAHTLKPTERFSFFARPTIASQTKEVSGIRRKTKTRHFLIVLRARRTHFTCLSAVSCSALHFPQLFCVSCAHIYNVYTAECTTLLSKHDKRFVCTLLIVVIGSVSVALTRANPHS